MKTYILRAPQAVEPQKPVRRQPPPVPATVAANAARRGPVVLLGELGPEFAAKFPPAKHFGSWLGLCPDNRITGGKIYRVRTRDVKSRVNMKLRPALCPSGTFCCVGCDAECYVRCHSSA